jgi:phosphomannomutase
MLATLNSYGTSGVRNIYGPLFNSEASATHGRALTTTLGDVLVGP